MGRERGCEVGRDFEAEEDCLGIRKLSRSGGQTNSTG